MSNETISVPLLPCPFCGQQDAFVEQLDSDASVVICQGRVGEHSACLARGPVGVQQHDYEDQPGHDEAVKEWNRRAAAQPQGEPVALPQRDESLGTAERDLYANGYPDLDSEAEAALEQALEPLKAWARKFCQPKFFTVEKILEHTITSEDVRAAKAAMAKEVQP